MCHQQGKKRIRPTVVARPGDPLLHALQAAAVAAPADARHFRGYLHYGVGDPRNGEPSPHYECLVSVMQLVTTLLHTTHGDEGPVRDATVTGALEFVRTYSQLIGTSLMSVTGECRSRSFKSPPCKHSDQLYEIEKNTSC